MIILGNNLKGIVKRYFAHCLRIKNKEGGKVTILLETLAL